MVQLADSYRDRQFQPQQRNTQDSAKSREAEQALEQTRAANQLHRFG